MFGALLKQSEEVSIRGENQNDEEAKEVRSEFSAQLSSAKNF